MRQKIEKLKLRAEVIPTLKFLWKNRKKHKYYGTTNNVEDAKSSYFNYPEYANLPQELAGKLNVGFVRAVQSTWPPWKSNDFNNFQREVFSNCSLFDLCELK